MQGQPEQPPENQGPANLAGTTPAKPPVVPIKSAQQVMDAFEKNREAILAQHTKFADTLMGLTPTVNGTALPALNTKTTQPPAAAAVPPPPAPPTAADLFKERLKTFLDGQKAALEEALKTQQTFFRTQKTGDHAAQMSRACEMTERAQISSFINLQEQQAAEFKRFLENDPALGTIYPPTSAATAADEKNKLIEAQMTAYGEMQTKERQEHTKSYKSAADFVRSKQEVEARNLCAERYLKQHLKGLNVGDEGKQIPTRPFDIEEHGLFSRFTDVKPIRSTVGPAQMSCELHIGDWAQGWAKGKIMQHMGAALAMTENWQGTKWTLKGDKYFQEACFQKILEEYARAGVITKEADIDRYISLSGFARTPSQQQKDLKVIQHFNTLRTLEANKPQNLTSGFEPTSTTSATLQAQTTGQQTPPNPTGPGANT